MYTYGTFSAGVSLFRNSYEAGIAVKAPQILGSMSGVADSGGSVCNSTNKPPGKLGIQVSLNLGIDSYAYAGHNFDTPSQKVTILRKYNPFYEGCYVVA